MITEHDAKMALKGYKYKLTPKNAPFEPIYSKTLSGIGPLMRDWPTVEFDVTPIYDDHKVSEMIESYVNGNKNDVIQILDSDHPALAAMFIYTAITSKKLDRGDVNTIVNRLLEKRTELFQG